MRTSAPSRRSAGSSPTIERTSLSIVFAAGCSILLTAITSGISMIPAFSAWTESPEPGMRTRTTVSAIPSPRPRSARRRRSRRTRRPCRRHRAAGQPAASPPRGRRDGRASPSSGCRRPGRGSGRRDGSGRRGARRCEKGLEGSTDTTPTVRSGLPDVAHERPDEAGLPHSRGAGDADDRRPTSVRVDLAHERARERVAVLHEGDRPGERASFPRTHPAHELVERQLLPRHARDSMRR